MKFIVSGAPSCFTLHVPPAVYASGSALEGEVEINLRELNEDEVEEVRVELRGSSYTCVRGPASTGCNSNRY